MAIEGLDVDAMTPEEFAQLVKKSSDDDLRNLLSELGAERVLNRVFGTIPERLKEGAASKVNDTLQFRVKEGDQVYTHALKLAGGKCEHIAGPVDGARSTVTADFPTFSKLITGQANEITLFLRRKLKIDGDLAFAQGFLRYFDRPKA